MKDVFLVCGISKQAHAQALKRAKVLRKKEALYIGFMYEIRDMHPGMGLRCCKCLICKICDICVAPKTSNRQQFRKTC
jgi:hypothetical protein